SRTRSCDPNRESPKAKKPPRGTRSAPVQSVYRPQLGNSFRKTVQAPTATRCETKTSVRRQNRWRGGRRRLEGGQPRRATERAFASKDAIDAQNGERAGTFTLRGRAFQFDHDGDPGATLIQTAQSADP